MSGEWVTVRAQDIEVGDLVRLASGAELRVSRVDHPFLGRTDLFKMVEATDERWMAYGVPTAAQLQVRRGD